MCRGGFTTTYTTAGAVTVAAAMIHALTDLNLCGALRLHTDDVTSFPFRVIMDK